MNTVTIVATASFYSISCSVANKVLEK